MHFLDLPLELHRCLGDLLPQPSLLAVSRLCRCSRAPYQDALDAHLHLDGTEALLRFLAQDLDDTKCDTWSCTRRAWCSGESRRRGVVCGEGGPIGAALALCPNALNVRILQTPLALTDELVDAFPSGVREVVFHSPHVDAAALAALVDRLPRLHTLDVSGVRTCACRGPQGAAQGREKLARALTGSALSRLVFTASKVTADNFFLLLKDCNVASIELRRSPVSGKALQCFLQDKHLRHLFVGGCKRVSQKHLTSLKCSCELEIDGRLLCDATIPETIKRLRIYHPCQADLDKLAEVITSGRLPLLSELIILPCSAGDMDALTHTLKKHGRPGATLTTTDALYNSIH